MKSKKKDNTVWISPLTDFSIAEYDEIFWFTVRRKGHEYGVNTYVMTCLSRFPRQIVAFEVDNSVKSKIIQQMVNRNQPFNRNYTDGAKAYLDVDFCGHHCRNIHDKSDTHLIEGSNADIRHYIAGLQRSSRCFFRKIESLKAVLWLFINAYNKFGEWKMKQQLKNPNGGRDYRCSHLDFVLGH